MKKKTISLVVLLSLLSGILVGCGTTQKDTNNTSTNTSANLGESGTVTLTVWGEDVELFEMMVESFVQQHSGEANFDISVVEQSEADAKGAVLGNVYEAADVFAFPDDQFSGLLASGVLEAVEDQQSVISANLDGSTPPVMYNDILYARPYIADNGYFLYYNKEYLSESDVETLDGILAVCEATGTYLSMDLSNGWYFYSFFGNTGLDMGINEDGLTNHCNWNATDTDITGLDVANAIVDVLNSPGFVAQGDGDFMTGVEEGTVIAGISGTWNAVGIKEAWGDNYGAAKLPTYTCAGKQIQMASFTGYKMMGVNYYSEQKEWAAKLADWFTNEQNQTLRFQMRNQGPSNKNAAASDEVASAPAVQAFLAQSEFGKLQRVGSSYWSASVDFADALINKDYLNVPMQDLLDTMVADITQSVAN